MNSENTKAVHEGRNVKRIREMLGVKQESLASALGFNQQNISLLGQKETIEPDILQEISNALKVPVEAIKNFDEEKTIYNISCKFSDNAVNNNAINIQNINPIEKWIEALEENKKLYERLVQVEREKVALFERFIEETKSK
jgi:transcriptional regulator with XRE-family HTH domain